MEDETDTNGRTDHEIEQHSETNKTLKYDHEEDQLVEHDGSGSVWFECECGKEFETSEAAREHMASTSHPIVEALESTQYDVVVTNFSGGNGSTYFDVDTTDKLGFELYDAVRSVGYNVSGTWPGINGSEKTRVWVRKQDEE